jgi:hypothetical protein
MHTITIDLESPLTPERVLGAAVDFSDRRPGIFPAVQAGRLRVHDLGTKSADVTEGTRSGPIVNWERCTYDWSKPGVVLADVTDSNIYEPRPSYWELRAEPSGEGSRVRMIWAREFRRTVKGRFFAMMFRRAGQRLFTKYAREILDNIENVG